MACPHDRTEFGQVIASNGTRHAMERCCACGTNVRGPGVWVPHSQSPAAVESLPVFKDNRTPKATQPSLFN